MLILAFEAGICIINLQLLMNNKFVSAHFLQILKSTVQHQYNQVILQNDGSREKVQYDSKNKKKVQTWSIIRFL